MPPFRPVYVNLDTTTPDCMHAQCSEDLKCKLGPKKHYTTEQIRLRAGIYRSSISIRSVCVRIRLNQVEANDQLLQVGYLY